MYKVYTRTHARTHAHIHALVSYQWQESKAPEVQTWCPDLVLLNHDGAVAAQRRYVVWLEQQRSLVEYLGRVVVLAICLYHDLGFRVKDLL